jgi:hypothetical protein
LFEKKKNAETKEQKKKALAVHRLKESRRHHTYCKETRVMGKRREKNVINK